MFVEKVLKVVESSVVPLGYEVIDIELDNTGLIRIFVDLIDGMREINLKDCELITRQLVYLLPVEGIKYERLEVSSPGVDRRLTKVHHFERFIGAKVKLKFRDLVAGKKNYIGVLGKLCADNLLELNTTKTPHIDDIRSDNPSSLFYIEENGVNGSERIEFAVDQLEQARLVEEISSKGKSA
jgi:ribosome maturation factor RimP